MVTQQIFAHKFVDSHKSPNCRLGQISNSHGQVGYEVKMEEVGRQVSRLPGTGEEAHQCV